MARMFEIIEDFEERGGIGRGSRRENEDFDQMLEKAFKEGCEHGYKKAMRESGQERGGLHRGDYREGFEEKLEKLKQKYK